jgi:hypothetical protein
MLGVRRLRSHPSLTTTTMKDVSQTSPPSPPAPPAANNTEPLRKEIDRVSHSNSPSSPGLPTEVENGAAVAQNSTEATTTAVPRHGPRERDSSWLELEACREHLRQTCPRQADECRYAHPDPRIYVKEGRVTCCYDFLKVTRFYLVHVDELTPKTPLLFSLYRTDVSERSVAIFTRRFTSRSDLCQRESNLER